MPTINNYDYTLDGRKSTLNEVILVDSGLETTIPFNANI